MKKIQRMALTLFAFGLIASSGQTAESPLPLSLESTIPLPNTAGRIDHLAVDLVGRRLFVAELGNNTLDTIDLAAKKPIHRIEGLNEPQGVAYLPGPDLLAVANGGNGDVKFFSGTDFAPRGTVMLADDADNIRVDPRNGQIFVGYGMGRLAIIDPLKPAWVGNLPLPAHPEGFQVSLPMGRIFVNVPRAGKIWTFDLASGKPIESWMQPGLEGGFPMALDEAGHAVIVAFRSPQRLAILDMNTGEIVASADTCGDADDVSFDQKRRRIYVSCGAGYIDVVERGPKGLNRLAQITTSPGARTSLFAPELDRLYLAIPSSGTTGAAIQIYKANP